MSYIEFHFPDQTRMEVAGSERANFGSMTEHHAKGAIGLTAGFGVPTYLQQDLAPFLNPEGPLVEFILSEDNSLPQRNNRFEERLAYHLRTLSWKQEPSIFAWKGREINVRQLILNTVLATGSDAMRMAVKIHWQCESHGYVMGYHRKWLADIVDEGMEEGVFRRGMGWEDLVRKLREAAQGPVVTSFSGNGDGYPNPYVAAGWMPAWPEGVPREWDALTEEQQAERDKRVDEWGKLDFRRQWELCVKGIKAPGRNRPWAPDTLRAYRFGHRLSLLDLYSSDITRIEKGLGIS